MGRGGELLGIDLLPRARVLADEIATARTAIDLRVLDPRRQDAVLAQRPRRPEQAASGARDHLIRRGEVLESVVDDSAHALGDRLILQMDAVNAAVDRVGALRLAVDPPIVALVGGQAPAP